MIEIEWKESSVNNFYKKMDNLVKNIQESAKQGLDNAMKETQKVALDLKAGSSDTKYLPYNVINESKFVLKGRLYADKEIFPHAGFLEFGTGENMDLKGPGIHPKTHTLTYFESWGKYWFVPKTSVDRQIGVDAGDFWLVYAQPPRPFMRPAAFSMRNNNIQSIRDALKRGIKEAIS